MSRTATDSTVLLGHGSGGQMMKRIIDEVFLDAFGSPELLEGNDAGVAALPTSGRIAMSTDSFVVSPQFFPGGNIGRLAVCGTVNDVATSGANVRYLSCGFILEEGYPMDKLRQIVQTMAETACEADVAIITGDTKVVERGGADGVYINTAGVGEVPAGVTLSGANCQPGDIILVSGTLGDHGIAIMSKREGLAFSSTIESDAAPLNHQLPMCLPQHPTHAASATPHAVAWRPRSTNLRRPAALPWRSTRMPCPYAPTCRQPARCSATMCCRWQTRARWSPWCRPNRQMRHWLPCSPPATARMPPLSVACCRLPRTPAPPCAYAPAGARPASSTCS